MDTISNPSGVDEKAYQAAYSPRKLFVQPSSDKITNNPPHSGGSFSSSVPLRHGRLQEYIECLKVRKAMDTSTSFQ